MVILKTAVGVFIGGLALLAVWFGPGWLQRQYDEANDQRAREIFKQLNPETVIERCGKPEEDETIGPFPETDGLIRRSLIYKAGAFTKIRLSFIGTPTDPKPLVSVNELDRPSQQREYWLLLELPCLEAGKR